jgi:pentatricopeptide repeat protein
VIFRCLPIGDETIRRSHIRVATAVRKEPGNVFSVAALIYGLGHAGQKEEAKRLLDQLFKKYEYVPCWFLAMAHGSRPWTGAVI